MYRVNEKVIAKKTNKEAIADLHNTLFWILMFTALAYTILG